jgi:hypothetical protein
MERDLTEVFSILFLSLSLSLPHNSDVGFSLCLDDVTTVNLENAIANVTAVLVPVTNSTLSLTQEM